MHDDDLINKLAVGDDNVGSGGTCMVFVQPMVHEYGADDGIDCW